jgi:hypothetical protein
MWNVAGVSPLFAALRSRPTIQSTPETNLSVQIRKNGDADRKTDLPPLLPTINHRKEVTIEDYDPAGETRSLSQRSRQPQVVMDYAKKKNRFETNERGRERKRNLARSAKQRA